MYTSLREPMITNDQPTIVGPSKLRYQWAEHWVRIPPTMTGQADRGAPTASRSPAKGTLLFHQADPAVVIYSAEGALLTSWGNRFPGAHGLTLVQEGAEAFCG